MSKNIISTIALWLTVKAARMLPDFYKSAFTAVEVYRIEAPDGAAVVRLSIDGAEFWISDGASENQNPESLVGGSVRMILTVSNPDEIFEQALKAGASEIFPVGEEHGWRLGRLVDPFGLHWEIGHPVE